MFKAILAKIGINLFRYLPLDQIIAKLLRAAIRKLLESRKAPLRVFCFAKATFDRQLATGGEIRLCIASRRWF